jgi:hypothetical protein
MDEASRRLLVTIKYALEDEQGRMAAGCWTACLMALAHQDATAATAWLAEFIQEEGAAETLAPEEKPAMVGTAAPPQLGA